MFVLLFILFGLSFRAQ